HLNTITMYKSIIALTLAIAFGSAVVSAAPTESGSWCFDPKNESYWGHATSSCCNMTGANMEKDRRCYGLNRNIDACHHFYRCCIGFWKSSNAPDDKCY
ncbi:hypothetical protein BGZ94_002026, partial [Podila epigama]